MKESAFHLIFTQFSNYHDHDDGGACFRMMKNKKEDGDEVGGRYFH